MIRVLALATACLAASCAASVMSTEGLTPREHGKRLVAVGFAEVLAGTAVTMTGVGGYTADEDDGFDGLVFGVGAGGTIGASGLFDVVSGLWEVGYDRFLDQKSVRPSSK